MRKPALGYGLICGAICGLIFMTALQNNWQSHPILRFSGQATIVVLFVFIFIAQYRQKYVLQKGALTFKQGMSTGLLVSLLTAVVMSICYVFYVKYLDPGFVNRLIASSESCFYTGYGNPVFYHLYWRSILSAGCCFSAQQHRNSFLDFFC
jgi:hypothetical protein